MVDTLDFDIIIIGAGISGLLLGSELSKEYKILVVEKQKAIIINKYWLTNKDVVVKNNLFQLNDCIDSILDHMDFIAYNGYKYRCFGDYILWDSNKLIFSLNKSIQNNGGLFLYSHRFYSYYYSKGRINIKINDKTLSTRLLIDCMGFESPISAANDMIKIIGYYLLYGSKLKLTKSIDPICLSNVILNQRAKYLEIFTTKGNYAYTTLLYPTNSTTVDDCIKKDFSFLVQESEYSHYFDQETKTNQYIGGVVPVGRLIGNSLDRIFLYGESALMNPSATGTCFTKLLGNYKPIANFLSEKLKTNKLSKTDLIYSKSNFSKKYNRKFQLSLYEEVLTWNSNDFLLVLRLLDESHNQLLNEILFEDIHFKSIINSKNLFKIIPKKKYYIPKLLVKSFFMKIS
jgi:flavin-dependent dehydrogenase